MSINTLELNTNKSELVIESIKLSSKLDKVECQIGNGFGAAASRLYKINIKRNYIIFCLTLEYLIILLLHVLDSPYIKTRSRAYRVPLRTPEVKLHCVITANPRAAISWMFLPRNFSEFSLRNKKNIPSTTASYNYNWILLNSFATYSFKAYPNHKETKHDETTTTTNNSQSHLQMLPISKYQIYEKVYSDNQIDSVLIIKVGIVF